MYIAPERLAASSHSARKNTPVLLDSQRGSLAQADGTWHTDKCLQSTRVYVPMRLLHDMATVDLVYEQSHNTVLAAPYCVYYLTQLEFVNLDH